jgi:EAL and modified HD-GYP domain-containing signal transduction protein
MRLNMDPRNSVYVARQPILDQAGKVFGYELLYRGAVHDTACTAEGDLAAARVLSDSLLALGLDTLTGGLQAFVNLTRPLLLNGAGTLLPKATTVLELREDIEVDAEVVEACARLHREGYSLALDDFDPQSKAAELIPYVKFVKVDVLAMPASTLAAIGGRLGPKGVRLVAEKVESFEVAKEARTWGYSLFQGYFFCRPKTIGTAALPSNRLAYLSLLAGLNERDLTVTELEDLVKHDVSLCYRVLRCINSAAYALRHEIRSIRQALLFLGLDQIRKWASVWALAGLNSATPETVTVSLVRARTCELIGGAMMKDSTSSEYFLLGLCSLLDAMLNKPMADALADLPLSPTLRDALLGQPNRARTVLDIVLSYERGEWDEAMSAAEIAGIGAAVIPAAYGDALRWARELSRHAIGRVA